VLSINIPPAAHSTPFSKNPCKVEAIAHPSAIYFLRNVELRLKPGCPANGSAQVRLYSNIGSSDPGNGWITLTPKHPSFVFRGVLLHPLNWRPQWRSSSGIPYDVRVQ
jgi:hypothetical protein